MAQNCRFSHSYLLHAGCVTRPVNGVAIAMRHVACSDIRIAFLFADILAAQ
jgi:hypothetical protein